MREEGPRLAKRQQDPREWRRHGLTPPAVLDALVTARVEGEALSQTEPTYADFFIDRGQPKEERSSG